MGGAFQIVGMMIVYPLLRAKKIANEKIFRISLGLALSGYAILLALVFVGFAGNLYVLLVPGILVFMANGILSVLTTVFLSGSVDYGEMQTGRREESVIFSMQTFVVKAASGVAVFLTGVGLDLIGLDGNTEEVGEIVKQSAETITGLRLLMTVLPICTLVLAFFWFKRKFKLTDAKMAEIGTELKERRGEA